MHERDETILFSAVAVLFAALTLGGLTGLASPDARAVANEREIHVSRDADCPSTAEAPAARTGADQHG